MECDHDIFTSYVNALNHLLHAILKNKLIKGLVVARIARDDPSTLLGDDPFLAPACTTTTMRGKFGSEFETYISYNAPMHFRHRQTDGQTDGH